MGAGDGGHVVGLAGVPRGLGVRSVFGAVSYLGTAALVMYACKGLATSFRLGILGLEVRWHLMR